VTAYQKDVLKLVIATMVLTAIFAAFFIKMAHQSDQRIKDCLNTPSCARQVWTPKEGS